MTLTAHLLIMSPHAQNVDDASFSVNLIDESMLDVDPPRIATSQISDKFFETRWSSEWVIGDKLQKRLSLRLQPRRREFLRILLRLP